MNNEKTADLLGFHFGSLDDHSRLKVESNLLADEELLIDYFDLKRKVEAAGQVPHTPSPALWRRLQPSSKPRRRFYLTLAVGAAVAASFVFLWVMTLQTSKVGTQNQTELLYDSNRELPANSNVL